MKTEVTTTITGRETVAEGFNTFNYKVECKRTDNQAFLTLWIIFKDRETLVDSVLETTAETFEENYINALERASINWKCEIKQVA